jgi:glycerophosphoryl diester phosphodiesterase
MTGDRRRIAELDAPSLRRLRLRPCEDGAYADERVPLLDELLAIVPEHVTLVLELKDPRFAAPTSTHLRRLVDRLGERARDHRSLVSCSNRAVFARVREEAPGLLTCHVARGDPFGTAPADILVPSWHWLLVNPWYVPRAHARGQLVLPMDSQPNHRLRRWVALAVDAVLTNDPAGTRASLDRIR